jgi:hypothetical protein
VRELPRERDTLLVRLMGAGEVLRQVVADLRGLPVGAWERRAAMSAVLALRAISVEIIEPTAEEAERTVSATQLYNEWYEKIHNEVVREGRREGRREEISRFFARRLGRELTETESGTLAERATSLGFARLEQVVLEMAPAALAAWLADASAQ